MSALIATTLTSCGNDDPSYYDLDDTVFEDVDLTCDGDECVLSNLYSSKIDAKIQQSGSWPYFIKVGETLTVNAPPENAKTISEDQRKFTWETEDDAYLKIAEKKGYYGGNYKAEITALRSKSTYKQLSNVKATNVYTPGLYANFNFRVIDFDPNTMYLWQSLQMKSSDTTPSALFKADPESDGSIKKENLVLGSDNSLKWTLTRDQSNSCTGSSGGVQLGANEKPENITLKCSNTRKVSRIIVETASKRSQATFSVKIGGSTVHSSKLKDIYFGEYPFVDVGGIDKTGDIELNWTTPKFDVEKIEQSNYVIPGATYIKAIWITFAE